MVREFWSGKIAGKDEINMQQNRFQSRKGMKRTK